MGERRKENKSVARMSGVCIGAGEEQLFNIFDNPLFFAKWEEGEEGEKRKLCSWALKENFSWQVGGATRAGGGRKK